MSLHIGDVAPDFSADTSTDKIILHDWIAKDWGLPLQPSG
jgi:alkyl hydroperoxide reductase subunit AhpC